MVNQQVLEECFVLLLQPLGILTAMGHFAKRRPWVRAGAFAFTAVTQTIWERDRQIHYQRTLVQLAKDKPTRLEAWKKAGDIPYWVFGVEDPNVETWDVLHGKKEIQHRLQTLYNSHPIWCKSLVVGASLGTLPVLQRASSFYVSKVRNFIVTGKWGYYDPVISMCGFADQPLNRMYAQLMGVNAYLNSDHFSTVGLTHGLAEDMSIKCSYETAREWRTHPMCWYSREAKLLIFQYNVEKDDYVVKFHWNQ